MFHILLAIFLVAYTKSVYSFFSDHFTIGNCISRYYVHLVRNTHHLPLYASPQEFEIR